MICNLTQNDASGFDTLKVISFKHDEVCKILGEFWSGRTPDFTSLCRDLADIAFESGANKAVIDVPPYAISTLELELFARKIIPIHCLWEICVELDPEQIIKNVCKVVESHGLQVGHKADPAPAIVDPTPVIEEIQKPVVDHAIGEDQVVMPPMHKEELVEKPVDQHRFSSPRFEIKLNRNFVRGKYESKS